ncbi:unnamed protein product, partial [Scytosiphon promiscuus]
MEVTLTLESPASLWFCQRGQSVWLSALGGPLLVRSQCLHLLGADIPTCRTRRGATFHRDCPSLPSRFEIQGGGRRGCSVTAGETTMLGMLQAMAARARHICRQSGARLCSHGDCGEDPSCGCCCWPAGNSGGGSNTHSSSSSCRSRHAGLCCGWLYSLLFGWDFLPLATSGPPVSRAGGQAGGVSGATAAVSGSGVGAGAGASSDMAVAVASGDAGGTGMRRLASSSSSGSG